eukprot:TRINITY_DN8240_c0_g1_i1.p1 TRINITY_DN8240_c0_g1~~TRINITY_DN8240_c0_g1_i1.p1  ORF type:complete len:417 (+),score=77.86 TRINITY_DN8240_c0_g1_i1:144-1394(+)
MLFVVDWMFLGLRCFLGVIIMHPSPNNHKMEDNQHPVVLKVRKLETPSFDFKPVLLSTEQGDVIRGGLDVPGVEMFSGSDHHAVSGALVLTKDASKFYRGQNVQFYVSVQNTSDLSLKDVSVQSMLQKTSARGVVDENAPSNKVDVFEPGSSLDLLAEFKLDSLGLIWLACSCTYFIGTDRRNMQKYFKLDVLSPLSINSSVNLALGGVVCCSTLKNETDQALYLDKVEFINDGDETEMMDMNCNDPEEMIFIEPNALRQYLYHLKGDLLSGKPRNILGELKIKWRTSFGEKGSFYSDPIRLGNHIPERPIQICFQDIPTLKVGIKSTISLEIRNKQDKEIQPKVTISTPRAGFLIEGITEQTTEPIPPKSSVTIPITILPQEQGFHLLDGIKIEDILSTSNNISEYKNILTLLIK